MTAPSVDINAITAELKAQFNGQREHDLQIIRDYCEKLSDSPADQAILAAIARFSLTEYPDPEAIKKAQKLGEAIKQFDARVTELQKMAAEKKFEEAAKGFEEILSGMVPVETEDTRYLSFSHPFESFLFNAYNQDKRKVVQISNLPEVLYYQYATILFELKRFDEAKTQLEFCLKLNPANVRARFELVEIAKVNQDLEEVRRLLLEVHPYIFTRSALARYYRNQAYLANLEGKFRLAVAMVYVSLDYEESPIARAQLNALAKVKGTDLSRPKIDEVQTLIQDTGIFLGPSKNVYDLAIEIGGRMREKNPDIARMAFIIAYEITHYKPLLRDLARLGVQPW